MKKIIFSATIVVLLISLVGCAEMEPAGEGRWYEGEQYWGVEGAPGYFPAYEGYRYNAPRRYYISDQDQQKYENMNDRIQQRMQTIQSNPSAGNNEAGMPASGFGTIAPAKPNHSSTKPAIPSVPVE